MSEFFREFWLPMAATALLAVMLALAIVATVESDRRLAECERAMALYVALAEIPVTTQQHGARLDAVRAKVHECLGTLEAR
jgi:hypothetical protein